MAVVRKYNTGGTAQKKEAITDFESFLDNVLDERSYTRQGYQETQQAALRLRDLAKSGKLDDAVTFDKIANKYTVDSTKLPQDLAQSLAGVSGDRPYKPNKILGKYNIGNQEEANSYLFSEYFNNYKPTVSASTKASAATPAAEIGIGSLPSYIIHKSFGGSQDEYGA